jgi:hypothetical protein
MPPGVDINQLAKMVTIPLLILIMVSPFIGPLILAGLIKLLNFVMGEVTEFKKIWTVTIYAGIPLLFQALLSNVLMFTANSDHLFATMTTKTSLAALVGPGSVSGFVFLLLAKLDIFTIWSLILTVIGVAQAFRSKISSVALVIFGVWIVYSLVSAYMGQASVSKLIGS